jgi:hypothetical protein
MVNKKGHTMKIYTIEVVDSFYGSTANIIKNWSFSTREKAEQKLAELAASSCYYRDLVVVEIEID